MAEGGLTASLRRAVIERARGCCEYCFSQSDFATQPFSIEHVFPRSKGGSNDPENLALSCQGCNAHKYNKTEGTDPLTRLPAPLFHPRRQLWGEHFTWNDDFTYIIGLTPTGRATIAVLKMNRKQLINLRRALFAVGEHPPLWNR
jgi:HNH endonuclease